VGAKTVKNLPIHTALARFCRIFHRRRLLRSLAQKPIERKEPDVFLQGYNVVENGE
jgi:hypothetical protein